jgi:cell division protein FtsL
MMLKVANFILVIMTLATASTLYSLEHKTRAQERAIASAKAMMVDHAEAIKLLKAEWSNLTRPERIQFLAEQSLGMKRMEPDQLVGDAEVIVRLEAIANTGATKQDNGIEDMLKKMQ